MIVIFFPLGHFFYIGSFRFLLFLLGLTQSRGKKAEEAKGSPPEIVSRFKGALPEWGGVSTLARMVWGT